MSEHKGSASEVETIIMPLFTLQELQCIQPPTFDLKVAQYRYDLYGGNPRYFMNPGTHPCDLMGIKFVRAEMEFFFGDSVANTYPDEWERNISRIASTLYQQHGDKASAFNMIDSMMRHNNGHHGMIWASQFMGFLAAAVQFNNNFPISAEFRKLFENSAEVGYLFKVMGHRKLLNSDKLYLVKPLLKSVPQLKPEFPVFLIKYPVRLIRTIEDIGNLPEKYYGLPVHCIFPFVDANIQPNTLVKFMICPEVNRDGGAERSIERIRDSTYWRSILSSNNICCP